MDGWCVLVPHHLLEGRSEPAEAVLSVFQLGSQRVCLSACGGEFAVALLELSGQFLDTGNKLSDGRLLDLLSEPRWTAALSRSRSSRSFRSSARFSSRSIARLAALAVEPVFRSRAVALAWLFRAASMCSRTPSA